MHRIFILDSNRIEFHIAGNQIEWFELLNHADYFLSGMPSI